MKKLVVTILVLLLLLTSCGTSVVPLDKEGWRSEPPSGTVEFVGDQYVYRVKAGGYEDRGDSYYLKQEYWVYMVDGGKIWMHFYEDFILDKREFKLK